GEMTFSSSLVKNLGRASRYALIYVPFAFAFDVLMLGVAYLFLSAFKIFFGLFFSMIVIVLLQALKMTIACFWMPAMTADKLPFKQAAQTAKKEGKGQFWKTFSVYVILVYIIIALNVLAVLCTFASGLIITVPISFMLLISFQYVNYYTVLGRRYFITYRAISINDEKGDSEHFFERVMQTESEKLEHIEPEEGKDSEKDSNPVENK
ncbi:MAG: hypothetical protein IJX18_01095, partial [Clostridia bacterium]|nr:hypothetical protein [Clostridia bacterium]